MKTVEALPGLLDTRIRNLFAHLVSAVWKRNGHISSSGVQFDNAGEYTWLMTLHGHTDVDISIEIMESDGEGPEDGVNFRMVIIKSQGGPDLSVVSVANYTEECWVSAGDQVALMRRWGAFSSAVLATASESARIVVETVGKHT